MPELEGKGSLLLAFFNIDYHSYVAPITEKLMKNPNKVFKLTLEEVKKKNA